MRICVTGGAGFIGSAFVRRAVLEEPGHRVLTLDALTYAGTRENLAELDRPNHRFLQVDLSQAEPLERALLDFCPNVVVHLAAETHVDRSIADPSPFFRSNLQGTYCLLEALRRLKGVGHPARLVHVSTDEVYGPVGDEAPGLPEGSRYQPSNPYSATKAAADQLVRGWAATYGLSAQITHCTNNYGPRQLPEKLIPRLIGLAMAGQPLPLYGDGLHRRDWLHVNDHVDALWRILQHSNHARGLALATWHIAAHQEVPNRAMVHLLCRILSEEGGLNLVALIDSIVPVADRPSHDRRYALDTRKLEQTLGWKPQVSLEAGLRQTVRWYLEHPTRATPLDPSGNSTHSTPRPRKPESGEYGSALSSRSGAQGPRGGTHGGA